jgi:SPP1 family predicted phage head-tail adaptor
VPINSGQLDRLISIERDTPARDTYGQPISSWSRIGRKRWARYRPLYGTERFIGDQYTSQQQVEFLVRWASDLSDLGTKDRIVYPIGSTAANSVYDVIAIHEEGRREGLRIMTARRSE